MEELLELAHDLKHLDGHTLFRPDPPRPTRQISTIDENEDENTQVRMSVSSTGYVKTA